MLGDLITSAVFNIDINIFYVDLNALSCNTVSAIPNC